MARQRPNEQAAYTGCTTAAKAPWLAACTALTPPAPPGQPRRHVAPAPAQHTPPPAPCTQAAARALQSIVAGQGATTGPTASQPTRPNSRVPATAIFDQPAGSEELLPACQPLTSGTWTTWHPRTPAQRWAPPPLPLRCRPPLPPPLPPLSCWRCRCRSCRLPSWKPGRLRRQTGPKRRGRPCSTQAGGEVKGGRARHEAGRRLRARAGSQLASTAQAGGHGTARPGQARPGKARQAGHMRHPRQCAAPLLPGPRT